MVLSEVTTLAALYPGQILCASGASRLMILGVTLGARLRVDANVDVGGHVFGPGG